MEEVVEPSCPHHSHEGVPLAHLHDDIRYVLVQLIEGVGVCLPLLQLQHDEELYLSEGSFENKVHQMPLLHQ
jgi:hypothetical protein